MKINEKPILNKRPAMYIAFAMLCGSALGGVFFDNFIAFAITASLLGALGALLAVKKKYLYFAMCLCMVLSMGLCCLTLQVANVDIYEENATISARICYRGEKEKGFEYRLEDITLNGSKIDYKAVMTTDAKFDVGNEIDISGDIKTYYLSVGNSYSISKFSKGIRYKVTPNNISLASKGKQKLTESTREGIINVVRENMGDEGGIAIAVLLGERSYINEDDYDAMEKVGIGHIFAVSGLHVMTIAGGTYFLLRVLKVGRKASHIAVIALLIFYGSVVGFSASILRAIIMCVVSILAELCERPPDLLSRLSLAVIVSLLIRPLSLFDLSFQMSYGAVAGIALIASPAGRYLESKIHQPVLRKVTQAVVYSGGIQLFMMPLMFYAFGVVGLYAVPANVLIVPMVSLAYMLLLAVVVINLIFPSSGILLTICGYPFIGFAKISVWLSSLPFADISFVLNAPSAFVFTLAIAVFSPILRLDAKRKTALSCALGAIGTLLAIFI